MGLVTDAVSQGQKSRLQTAVANHCVFSVHGALLKLAPCTGEVEGGSSVLVCSTVRTTVVLDVSGITHSSLLWNK